MSRNHFCPGIVGDFTNNTGAPIAPGDLVLVGVRVAVALVAIPVGATGSVQYKEVFLVKKTAAQAWTNGQRLYFNAGTSAATTTVGSNAVAGVAFKDALAADTVGYLALNE